MWSYVPDAEYQIYPGRKIVYLKVTATITGYQPRDKEIEGRFIGPTSRTDVDSILNTFLPCNGAILQVTVGPQSGEVALEEYPYFMDFQPKKRELYEMATDTAERSSRSLEETKVGKASGTAHSQEVLDVDQGGSAGGSGKVSAAGYGLGSSVTASAEGQWGSKHLTSDQLGLTRSSDESRDRRETQSHTTQLSQMYNLLESYHVGTNRAVFLISPRPHVLDSSSSLVKGPRPIDGIQEFFLVVNQPANQDHLCVGTRLDTGHLTTVPIMSYDRRPDAPVRWEAHPTVPNREDLADGELKFNLLDGDDHSYVGELVYACFKTSDHQSSSYSAPAGYIIEDWEEVPGGWVDTYGASTVEISKTGGTLTITCDATSRLCYYDHIKLDADRGLPFPSYTAGAQLGSVVREVRPLLRSINKTKQNGETKVLLLTTRGVCCCIDGTEISRSGVIGIGSISLDPNDPLPGIKAGSKAKAEKAAVAMSTTHAAPGESVMSWGGSDTRFAAATGAVQLSVPAREGPEMSAREANELGARLREGIIQLHTTASAAPVPYVETELFIQQLHQRLLARPEGAAELSKSASHLLPGHGENLDRSGLVMMSTEQLAQARGLDANDARRLKLKALGLVFAENPSSRASKGHV
ncbi:MAG: hypothetical protein NVS1B6_01410 [Steroidobacteraceae bacterium]